MECKINEVILIMKELQTIPRKRIFRYEGSFATGITLYFGTGRKEIIEQRECQLLIKKFRTQKVAVGRSFNNPPPDSLGEWLLENVTKRAIASYVAPILVEEGYARWIDSKELQF
jgi:hypothetical protein